MIQQNCKWIYPEIKEISTELIETAGSRIIAQLLINRGIESPEKAKAFLCPDEYEFSSPYVFEDMEKSVNRVNQAIKDKEHVVIYGDFDADGVASTSLLYKTLKYLGADVSYYIPDRTIEGHGLNSAAVLKLISSKKAKLIITVDCGVSNLTEIALAKNFGTDVIITDHHEGPEVLPPAYAIINPKIISNNSDLANLAGVGVAFKLAQALLEANDKQDFTEEILYLVAIGSIADVVPLIGENRALVTKGLKLISKKRPKGLIKLLETAGTNYEKGVSADMIGFGVAPRINAIGRLAEAALAVELLVSDDDDEIENAVNKLNYNNRIRQQMCENTFIEACNKVFELDLEKNKAIILADPNWHPGIIGIVASKLVEKFYRPAFLISIDEKSNEARCSARGIEGLNLHDTLSCLSDQFVRFGGHAFAAGFLLDLNTTNFKIFKEKLNSIINENLDLNFIKPRLHVDIDLLPEDLNVDFVNELDKLAPFGECNPAPVFSMSNLTLKQCKTMGSNNNHLKIFLSDDNNNVFEAVWWQKNTLDTDILEKINIAFSPEINNFANKTSIQLVVKDIQPVNENKKTSSTLEKLVAENSIPFVKWIDHRKKTGVEKVFSNYLKTSKDIIAVFAENQDTLNLLDNSSLKSRVISRLKIQKADQLLLFDLPSDWMVLSNLLEHSGAKIVHLIGRSYNGTDPVSVIKTLSGMLKYAYSNKNGEISISKIASKLSTSNMAVKSCINLLNSANIINVLDHNGETVKYVFIGSADLSSVRGLKEYDSFLEAIKNTEEFRKTLAVNEIEKIKTMANKFSREIVSLK